MVIPSFLFGSHCDPHTVSSDLWLTGTVPGAQDTGKSADVSYAIGEAKGVHVVYTDLLVLRFFAGNINLAPLGFDNYTVSSQAFSKFYYRLVSYLNSDAVTTPSPRRRHQFSLVFPQYQWHSGSFGPWV